MNNSSNNTPKYQIAFIGVGRMAKAMIKGFIKSGAYRADQIIGTHYDQIKAAVLSKELGIRMSSSNDYALSSSRIIYICN